MNEAERMRILEMLQEGKINAAEAADLLSAIEDRGRDRRERTRWSGWGAPEPPPRGPHRFRLRVTDTRTGREHANFTLPLGMLGVGIGIGKKFRMPGNQHMDVLMDAVRQGRRGTIFDVSGGDGERVEIIIE
jgi:hypothetical protein